MTESYDASWTIQERMVSRVAKALGPELNSQIAFVGGCATALLVTDDFTSEAVRFTEDVDVIVQVIGQGQWYQLERQLRQLGFRSSPDDDVLCRFRLRDGEPEELIVDFMPDDESILGFSNQWYREALESADKYTLPNGVVVRVVSPPYFVATKLQAYRGRGENDPLHSRDIEDILNIVDGRPSLLAEVAAAPEVLRSYIATELQALVSHRDFDYAVQACARNSRGREGLIFDRLAALQQP